MPLESGVYLQDLDDANPTGADIKGRGDDHLRLIKRVLKNTFPNATKPIRLQDRKIKSVSGNTVLTAEDEGSTVSVTGAGDVTITLPFEVPIGFVIKVKYAKVSDSVRIEAAVGDGIYAVGVNTDIVASGGIVLNNTYEEVTFIKNTATFWSIEGSTLLGNLSRPWQPFGSQLLTQITLSSADPIEANVPDGTLYLKYDLTP